MSKGAKATGPGPEARTTVVSSAAVQFSVDYEQAKQLPIGKAVYSEVVSTGAHLWRIECFPRADDLKDEEEYLSVCITHMSKMSRSMRAILEVYLMDRNGIPSRTETERTLKTFRAKGGSIGCSSFIKGTTVEKDYLLEGHITFVCAIIIIRDGCIPVPPSDIGVHLGSLLDHTDGTDVAFIVDGETFHAHRAVLAARSPVFRAELFGSMAEATMSSIERHDIMPATFKAMLHFIYTDALPGDDELGCSPVEVLQDLLAAADRYALDRLKLICAQKLLEHLSVDTVATTLACAETYNCPELKNKCFDFFAVEKNFKKAVFTAGFAMLLQKFPSITDELKSKVET
ncbi:BTB/POZ and MATH domain-containing protein 1 [Brachypodium distachyon]|uniref:BTB domain-containing protein n=1 Tax=Brachypodium distachyon TaxID=15368 RepID=A0A0Q3HZW1_BRADI|nr:BTB/POZ and MATH domain-containing protein 1 [Brachypodium distachyon]KQJ99130.1 hypothetical protein BRADI_3g41284v3 [Brachypodium distachyon]|eukprot:XP_014756129.1 BTB/POZ and MATH domain-containing protein 1 [Brachypodium distachyon]